MKETSGEKFVCYTLIPGLLLLGKLVFLIGVIVYVFQGGE